MSCGTCDLAGQLLKASSTNWRLINLICELVHRLIITDLELLDGQQRCQEKFASMQLCEHLIHLIQNSLQNYQPSSNESSLSNIGWPMKVLGSLGRWNEDTKVRLFHGGLCNLFPLIAVENLRNSSFLTECISWCVANVSYPDGNMQDVLGSVGVVDMVVAILDFQRENKVVIYEACRAIRNLCCNHDSNLERAMEKNVMEIFQVLVLCYENDDDVLQWIMFALATLITSHNAVDRLNQLSMPSKIVSILRKYVKNADIVQWIALVLSTLARQSEMADQLAVMNTCEALVMVCFFFSYSLCLFYNIGYCLYGLSYLVCDFACRKRGCCRRSFTCHR